MKTKRILLTLLSTLMVTSLSACGSGNNPTPKPSTTQTTPVVTPSEEDKQLTFRNVSLVYDEENLSFKVNFELQITNARVTLRLYDIKEGYDAFYENHYTNGSSISLIENEIREGEYRVILFAEDEEGQYRPSEDYTLSSTLTIEYPIVEIPIELTNVQLKNVERIEDGDYPGWYATFSYDPVNRYSSTYVYLFDSSDNLVRTYNRCQIDVPLYLGDDLEAGTYHFTMQVRGGPFNLSVYQKYFTLNSDVVLVPGTFTVEPVKPQVDPIKLEVTNIDLSFDHIVFWNCNASDVKYNVMVFKTNGEFVYSKEENTHFHALQVNELEHGEDYDINILALGDEVKYLNSEEETYSFRYEPEYSYVCGPNPCGLTIEELDADIGIIRANYSATILFGDISMTIYDNETGDILAHSINQEPFTGRMTFSVRNFSGKTLRFELCVYDANHEYRDGTASAIYEVPTYPKDASIEEINVLKVDSHLEIEVITDGEYDHMSVNIQFEDTEEQIKVETIENGKYIVDISEYPYTSARVFVSLYDVEENELASSVEYYSAPEMPHQPVIYELECEMEQTVAKKERTFTFTISSNIDYYPMFKYEILQGNQPIMDDFIGAPNFDPETETYSNVVSFTTREANLKKGETYTMKFFCIKRNFEQTEDIYMLFTTEFVAL